MIGFVVYLIFKHFGKVCAI